MQKLLGITLLLLGTSAYGAHFSHAEIETFKPLFETALLKDQNEESVRALSDFIQANPKFKNIGNQPIYNGYSLGTVLGLADSRLFKNRKSISALFDFLHLIDEGDLGDSVTHIMEEGDNLGSVDFALGLVKHAFDQYKINVNKHFVPANRTNGKLTTLGAYIDARKNQANRYWGELETLVANERGNKNYQPAFGQNQFIELICARLTDLQNSDHNLRTYMTAVGVVPNLETIASPERDKDMGQFLDDLHPEVFPRNAVLALIAPARNKPTNKVLSVSAYVASLLRDRYTKLTWLDLDGLSKVYAQHPICADEFEGSVPGITLGQEIDQVVQDSGSFYTREARQVQNLVSAHRKSNSLEKTFLDLVLQCLAADKVPASTKAIKNFVRTNKTITSDKIKAMTISLTAEGTAETVSLVEFLHVLPGELFPNKEELFKVLKVDQKAQNQQDFIKCLQTLIVASIETPIVLPLVKQAMKNYRLLHPDSKDITLETIKYKDTTIAEYLAERKDSDLSKAYAQIFAKALPKTKKDSTSESTTSSQKETNVKEAGSGTSWKKVVVIGSVVAVVAFLAHKYLTTKDQNKSSHKLA